MARLPWGCVERCIKDLRVAPLDQMNWPIYVEDEKVTGLTKFDAIVEKVTPTVATEGQALRLIELIKLLEAKPQEIILLHPRTDQRYSSLETDCKRKKIQLRFY